MSHSSRSKTSSLPTRAASRSTPSSCRNSLPAASPSSASSRFTASSALWSTSAENICGTTTYPTSASCRAWSAGMGGSCRIAAGVSGSASAPRSATPPHPTHRPSSGSVPLRCLGPPAAQPACSISLCRPPSQPTSQLSTPSCPSYSCTSTCLSSSPPPRFRSSIRLTDERFKATAVTPLPPSAIVFSPLHYRPSEAGGRLQDV